MSLNATVGELVVKRPSNARVFERFGIDYCCGGRLPLAVACERKGIDPAAVLAALEQDADRPQAQERDWSAASFGEITSHIESTHHAYLKRELPRLEQLTDRVAARHGEGHPELRQLHQVFLGFKAELEAHMAKEERVLFPMCRGFDGSTAVALQFHCGSIQNPVAVMVHEHDRAGDDLRQMRELTGDYVPPKGACSSYRALLAGLAELEADMHRHVHLENNILFPRAVAAERKQGGCGV